MKINNILFIFPFIKLFSYSKRLFTTIKNYNKPICANCKFYKPENYNNYYSTFNKCVKFGEKNLENGNINYVIIKNCRNDITKCGEDGTEYEKENNLLLKKINHHFSRFFFIYFVYILSFILYKNFLL